MANSAQTDAKRCEIALSTLAADASIVEITPQPPVQPNLTVDEIVWPSSSSTRLIQNLDHRVRCVMCHPVVILNCNDSFTLNSPTQLSFTNADHVGTEDNEATGHNNDEIDVPVADVDPASDLQQVTHVETSP